MFWENARIQGTFFIQKCRELISLLNGIMRYNTIAGLLARLNDYDWYFRQSSLTFAIMTDNDSLSKTSKNN